MSNYIEPEMEKVKLEEENLEDVSGGICINIKREENDGKYCTKIKTDGICIGKDKIDAKICTKIKTDGNDPDNIIIITGEDKSSCRIVSEIERSECRIVS